jgi:hypothetical protein
MARSKPNELKSPHKQQLEDQKNKDKTENKSHITPQTSKTNKKATGIEEQSIEISITHEKYIRNPENIPYYDGDTKDQRIYRRDRNQHQLDEEEETINSTHNTFVQPADEDAQGNILTDKELAKIRVSDVRRTPSKEDSKPSAQPENEDSSPSPEQHRKRLSKQDHALENIKKLFANLAENTQNQLKEQGDKHAMKITVMKRSNLNTHNLLITNTIPAQTMNDHISTAHFNAMTKPSDTLFDGTPDNWPAFKHHILTESENRTISWNQHITNYQPNENSEPFNFLERYFDRPDDMTNTLMNKLADAKQIVLVQPASQLFKLHCLKTKPKNCLTTDLAHDIDASVPTGLSHKDGRLFFIKLVYHTFPDKEAHKRIIYEYILKLETTKSNNMESFTRELRRHIKQYDAIQGSEWYHQTIPENRFASIQHRIQHDHCTGAINSRHQIRIDMHPPRVDQQYTS